MSMPQQKWSHLRNRRSRLRRLIQWEVGVIGPLLVAGRVQYNKELRSMRSSLSLLSGTGVWRRDG